MQWIKSHLVIVIVASVSLLSLTGLVLGYVMSSVGADLETDARELTKLQGIKRVNPKVIDAARKQQQEDAARLADYFRKYQEAKQYTPLDDQVFADNITDSQRQAAIFRFQDKYQPKSLLQLLKAKDQPTAEEFTEYEQEIKAKQDKIEKELGVAGGGRPSEVLTAPTAPRAGALGQTGTSADQDASRRLRMAYAVDRAKQVYCYASEQSLDDRTAEVKTVGGTPPIEDLWYAQVALWIQEDIFRALGGLNEASAKELPEEARWVAYLPVKRLIKFTMGNYVPRGAAGDAEGGGSALRGGPMGGGGGGTGAELLTAGPTAVFTKRVSSETVDVVRFHLDMVVDARRLLDVLDAISKAGFYTPLNVDLREVVPAPEEYYIYGTAPVLQMTVVYEGSFMRSSYDKFMPTAVKNAIAEGRAGGLGKAGAGLGGTGIRPPAAFPGHRGTPRGGRGEYREDFESERPRSRRN
ncbi:MAG TPA: hypothetical protein PLL20_17940 [Phycisphaerae bacterium]|nr:hypothetical protein [Phycisphaerae bacterium]HRR84769.1 hypothetical protein [Phycisphaerae bacterium]